MKMGQIGAEGDDSVVSLPMDANFFFERAVSSLDRHHYDKALKYFRRAAELEPDNPINHCNLAGILSEMGDYEASNQVLSDILDHVDPAMVECHFFMANNYANMEQFEAAEEALAVYLEKDETGQYYQEAEEMRELLQYELKRPVKIRTIKCKSSALRHEEARQWLEEGKFKQAINRLEEIVAEQPDFLAARNNLALGYYYIGLFRQAREMVEEVLKQDAGNLHALCNLSVFLQNEGRTEELNKLKGLLRNIVPFHEEHLFKLATTMGILQEHHAVYRHFMRLIREYHGNVDPCIYHYAAVAAYHIDRYDEARSLWLKLKKLDSDKGVASYYLNRLDELELSAMKDLISYQYELPFEEQLKQAVNLKDGLPRELTENPQFCSSLHWALRYGDKPTKLQAIQAFRWLEGDVAKEALLAFLLEPDEPSDLKNVALLVLGDLGVSEPIPIHNGSSTMMVEPG